MIIKKTTTTILFLFLLTGILFVSGCGNKGIEGTWVLTEEYEADGTKITSKELEEQGVSETYEINGTAVVYTCEMKSMKKPIVINFELEDLGDNKYNFKLNGKTCGPWRLRSRRGRGLYEDGLQEKVNAGGISHTRLRNSIYGCRECDYSLYLPAISG